MGDHATFAEAVAATGGRVLTAEERAPASPPPWGPAPTSSIGIDSPIIDIRTGEFLAADLADEPMGRLVDLAVELRVRAERFTLWRKALEAELTRRLEADGRRMAVVGDQELNLESGRRRVWDPDDLEAVAKHLVAGGVVTAGELAGLIRTERKVDGTMARDLVRRLTGEPKAEVEACFRWQTGPSRLKIVPSVDLADALPKGQLPDPGFEQVDNEGYPDRSR